MRDATRDVSGTRRDVTARVVQSGVLFGGAGSGGGRGGGGRVVGRGLIPNWRACIARGMGVAILGIRENVSLCVWVRGYLGLFGADFFLFFFFASHPLEFMSAGKGEGRRSGHGGFEMIGSYGKELLRGGLYLDASEPTHWRPA